MSVVVGYVSTKEGKAALRRAAEECALRSADLIVVHSTRGGRHADGDEILEIDAELDDVEARVKAAGLNVEIRHLVRPGQNLLEIAVTNTLINRVAGLDAFPEVPPDLQPVFGNGLHESTPAAEALRGFEPLPPSGLLGPVRITPLKRVRIGLNHAE